MTVTVYERALSLLDALEDDLASLSYEASTLAEIGEPHLRALRGIVNAHAAAVARSYPTIAARPALRDPYRPVRLGDLEVRVVDPAEEDQPLPLDLWRSGAKPSEVRARAKEHLERSGRADQPEFVAAYWRSLHIATGGEV